MLAGIPVTLGTLPICQSGLRIELSLSGRRSGDVVRSARSSSGLRKMTISCARLTEDDILFDAFMSLILPNSFLSH